MIGVFGCFCDKKLYHLHDVKRLFKIQNYLNYGFFVGICKWFYEKIKSHFNLDPLDFGLNINYYTNGEDEYLESLEITNIIKKDQ